MLPRGRGASTSRRRRPAAALLGMALLASAAAGASPRAQPAPAQPRTAPAGQELDALLARLDGAEKAYVGDLARIQVELDLVEKRTVLRARQHVRNLRAGLLPAGGGFEALVDHAARVERVRRALTRDLARQAELGRERVEIGARLERVRAERSSLEVQREAMLRARRALEAEDERHAAFKRAFESSVRPDYVAVYGADTGGGDPGARRGFAGYKGRLPFPVAGRAEVRRVSRPSASGPGLELSTLPGAAARAVAPGRVAFADHYSDHGLTVLVDHGDRYFSLYGNLGAAEVAAGDAVGGGARLGSAGQGGTGTMLYFELRRGESTLDPAPWMGM